MGKFLRSISYAAIIFFAAYWVLSECVLRFPSVFVAMGYAKEWAQVAQRIEVARKTSDADTLYIGDSVGGQLVPFEGDSSLCSNGAVLVAGNYLLVERAIRNRPNVRTVVYLSSPQGLGNRFERARTCNNFLKPFLRLEHVSSLDRSVFDRMDRNRRSYLYFLAPMKLVPLDELDLSDGTPDDAEVVSDFNLHWLPRLDSLFRANGIQLMLLSAPVSEGAVAKTKDWSRLRAQTNTAELAPLFGPYFRSMIHLPDSLLRDNVHWKRDFMDANREALYRRILSASVDDGVR
jgi:hypothetical protein